MRRSLGTALGFALAGLAFAGGDDRMLPVGDLVARKGPSNRLLKAVQTQPVRVDLTPRTIAGEEGLLKGALDEGAPPWYDSQTICGSLDEMLAPSDSRTTFDDSKQSIVFAESARVGVERGLAQLRARVPQPIAMKVSLTRMTGREGIIGPEQVFSAEATADPARTLVLADAVERSVVDSYDVEVAQASSIGDPILSILRTGVSVAVCVTPMPDGRSAVIETVTRVARDLGAPAIELGHRGFGDADRCAVAFDEVGACVVVPNGRPTNVIWTGRNGTTLQLKLEAAWTPPPPPGEPAVIVSPLFRSGFWGFRNVPPPESPHEEVDGTWAALDQRTASAEELVAASFHDPEYRARVKWNGSVLVLPASSSGGAAERCRAFCDAANAHLAAARVECLAVNVPAGATVAFDAPLPGRAFTVASFDGPAVLGLPLTSTGGTERRYLADWDVEVAQSSRIPDPQFMPLATGHFLDLTPRATSVDIDLDLRRLDDMKRQSMSLAVGRTSQGVQGDKDTSFTDPLLPSETVAVEKPLVAALRVVGTIPLDAAGTGSLRQSGDALLGAGRELVVLVRVR